MANTARMSMQKRAREQKKAEKAALKRESKRDKKEDRGSEIASDDDLAAYGAAPAAFTSPKQRP